MTKGSARPSTTEVSLLSGEWLPPTPPVLLTNFSGGRILGWPLVKAAFVLPLDSIGEFGRMCPDLSACAEIGAVNMCDPSNVSCVLVQDPSLGSHMVVL